VNSGGRGGVVCAGHWKAGELPISASLLAQEFSGFPVDEMKPGAGETDDGHVGIGTALVLRRRRRQPVLDVRAQMRTFEKDMPAHKREYAELMRRITSVWLRSWEVPAGGATSWRLPPNQAALLSRLALGVEALGKSATR
jgi:hypothetical protein